MSFFEQVERMLWRRGFVQPQLRVAVRNLLIFSMIFFALGLALLPWMEAAVWAGMAALLSCWNFYTLARFIQSFMPAAMPEGDKKGRATAHVVKKSLLFRTYLRLFITGLFVYVVLVHFQASPAALAIGFSVPVTIIPLSLIFQR